ncbi:hypothetical protein CA13_65010 [Planctomycetes bacterium CA13]|uniref:Uncharacterized protein n=1 Tax=Novipirellula herctigrandis TaxID=2527986 RepID=A0A5C5ZC75_9BACT|nr:hypothetical protein CA13_65010 [Planctomycetes bacterium CA13]
MAGLESSLTHFFEIFKKILKPSQKRDLCLLRHHQCLKRGGSYFRDDSSCFGFTLAITTLAVTLGIVVAIASVRRRRPRNRGWWMRSRSLITLPHDGCHMIHP